MPDKHSNNEHEYNKAYEDWDLQRFYSDMAESDVLDTKTLSPNAKRFLQGILCHKTPAQIAKDCRYGGKDPSGTVRKIISNEIRPAVEALCKDNQKQEEYKDYKSILSLLAPKYRIDRSINTRATNKKEDYKILQEAKEHIEIQLSDLDTLSFGTLKTTWLVKDGTGEREYYRDNIACHYQNEELELPEEIEKSRMEIAQQQEEKKLKGEALFWNGSRYSFDRFVITRTTHEENPCLDFWFKPSDYYTFLATNQRLDRDKALRDKYFKTDWQQPVSPFANAFAVYLSVITEDKYLIITQRGLDVGSRPGELNISVNEGLSRDKDHVGGKPDLYNLGTRAIHEELGISVSYCDLKYLSFGVDVKLGHWAIIGMTNIAETRDFVERRRSSGVEDKWENTGIYFVKFELKTVIDYVLSSKPWAPGAIACIYHTLVNEFGRDECDLALMKRV